MNNLAPMKNVPMVQDKFNLPIFCSVIRTEPERLLA